MRLLFSILFLGAWLMGNNIDLVEVDGVKVPLIYEKSSQLPIVSMQLVFKSSGSINDSDLSGLARLVAKLYGKGTLKKSSTKFAAALEQDAISLSANAGNETFVFELSSLKSEFKKGLKLFEELLLFPNISKKTLKSVKTNLLGAISQKESDFDYVASRLLKSMLFKDTALEHPTLGTAKTLKMIELKDVEKFIKKHLIRESMVVVIGGDIGKSEAKNYVKKIASLIKKGEYRAIKHVVANSKQELKYIYKDTEQAYIYFGAPFNMRVDNSEYYKAKVAVFVLGAGGFGSRLMEEVRVKRGLAYSAYARVNVSNSNSYFSGYLQTKLESQNEAVELIKELIGEFVDKGITQKELDGAKKFILGSEPLRVETLSQRLNRTFMEYYRGVGIGNSKEELKKIETLTLKEINAFIASHPEIKELMFAMVTHEGKR